MTSANTLSGDISNINNNKNHSAKFENFKNFLNSKYALLAYAFCVVLFWAINFIYGIAIVASAYTLCVFIFCKDNPVAFMLPVLSTPYAITTYNGIGAWIVYATFFAFWLTTTATYVLRQVIVHKKKCTKGKMFWVFVAISIGSVLGNLFGRFDMLVLIITSAILISIYGFYWFCLNFVKNYKKYFCWVLVFLGLIISAEMAVSYLSFGDIIYALQNKLVRIGSGEINPAAVFLVVSVCACFYLGLGSKRDYLFVLLALFFDIMIFLTYTRIALLAGALLTVAYFIVMFTKSQNKRGFLFSIGGVILAFVILLIVSSKVKDVFEYYISLAFNLNGRDALWPWCFEQFKTHPWFGIGYTSSAAGASEISGFVGIGGGEYLVNCHNTALHYMTCNGLFGLILAVPFYVKKYMIIFKKFNYYKLFSLMAILGIAICGLVDCSPTVNIIVIYTTTFIIALAEKDTAEQENEKLQLATQNGNTQNNNLAGASEATKAIEKTADNKNAQITKDKKENKIKNNPKRER